MSSASEDEELNNLRQLIEAEESGDHQTLGKAQADYLRAVSNIESDDGLSKAKRGSSQYKTDTKVSKNASKGSVNRFQNGWNQSVAKLLKQKRHKKPVIVSPEISVFKLASVLCQERRNAALVRDGVSGKIVGIITDADICKRVVGVSLKPKDVDVGSVMTKNPISVGPETDILEIFDIMCKNRFRHLPILDDSKETVYGLVDIAQCLYDAIQRIEKAQKKEIDFMHTVQRAHLRWNSDSEQVGMTAVLAQEIINDMMERICPKVSIILNKEKNANQVQQEVLILSPSSTIQDAVDIMAKTRKTAVLGVDSSKTTGGVFGIFTTKDLLSKVVAAEKNPEDIKLSEVMTKNPDTVEAESSLLEALHIMHDGRFLHVPVVMTDADTEVESVVGILDVLDCAVHTLSRFTHTNKSHLISSESEEHDYIYNTKVDSEADRAMFTSLFLRDDGSEPSILEKNRTGGNVDPRTTVNIGDSVSQTGNIKSQVSKTAYMLKLKIKDARSNRLFRSQIELEGLNYAQLVLKVKTIVNHRGVLTLYYLDEDGDQIMLTSNECLTAALHGINPNGDKLTIVIADSQKISGQSSTSVDLSQNTSQLLMGGLLVAALIVTSMVVGAKLSGSGNDHYNRYR